VVSGRPFRAYLPESLRLEEVTCPGHADYARWVVSTVVFRRFVDRAAGPSGFVPLDSRYAKRHIPAKVFAPLMADLTRDGRVLECDDVYYFGPGADGPGKCRCYRLGAAYRDDPVRGHDVFHRELLRKLEIVRAEERAAVTDPTHLALRAWHDRVTIAGDAPYGAHPLLDRMMDGERRFTVCPQGRVHTNVANLPVQFRQYVRLDDWELKVVDVAASQPNILSNALKQLADTTEDEPNPLLYRSSNLSLTDFHNDCRSGAVYDVLAGEAGLTRDEVKPLFLAVVYGHPADMDTRVGRALRAVYPGVYAAVAGLNRGLGRGGLPRRMQALESRVMIGRVAARLVQERPEMPLLTVHDSVVAPAESIGYVRGVIEQEWEAEFGDPPRTKTSSFTAPQEARVHGPKRRGRSAWKTEREAGGPGVKSGRLAGAGAAAR
jgi:hypothetical protein